MLDQITNAFCWSKMGTEAGEELENIIQRKEIERVANGGVFTWGVGSSLGDSLRKLKEISHNPRVVFTRMLSKPKAIDVSPTKLFMWVSYFGQDGNIKPLPKYCFVTSRGNNPSETKKRNHYALICESGSSLKKSNGGQLDGSCLVNLKSGKQVGASQVTSVVRYLDSECTSSRSYTIEFIANLKDEGQVKLADFVEIMPHELIKIKTAASSGDVFAWKRAIEQIREKYDESTESSKQHPYQNDLPMFG